MRFRRWKMRRRQKLIRWRKRGGLWFLAFVVLFALAFQILWLLEKNMKPTLVSIAKTEVKQMATEAVLEATREQVNMGNELDEIMKVEKGRDGSIQFIRINQQVQAKVYERTQASLQKALYGDLKKRTIRITLGQAMQSNILAEHGPKIPVKIWPKSSSPVHLRPQMESAGVNNVMVTLIMRIQTEMGVVVPFSTEAISVDTEIPLAQALVVGEVPRFFYYNDMGGKVQKGTVKPGTGSEGSQPQSQPMPVLPPVQVED